MTSKPGYCPPTFVCVAGLCTHCQEYSVCRSIGELAADRFPVPAEAIEKFNRRINPAINAFNRQSSQHGVFFEQAQGTIRLPKIVHELAVTLGRCVAVQVALQASDVQFQRHCSAQQLAQVVIEFRREDVHDRRGIERCSSNS